MAKFRKGFEFGITGRLAEELLGGDSVKPQNNPALVDSMYKNGELFHSHYRNGPKYKRQIEDLARGIKALLNGADDHDKARSEESKAGIRKKMLKIKAHFDHNFLQEALIRYTINAHDKNYTPWAPGPLKSGRGRNEFIGELQEKLCDHYNTDLDNVRFFNAASTPLDILYSTDGFFVIDGSLFYDGEKRVVLIDVSIDYSKKDKEFNPSGSLILFIDPKKLDDQELERYQKEFSERIKEAAPESGIRNVLDDFTSQFDAGKAA